MASPAARKLASMVLREKDGEPQNRPRRPDLSIPRTVRLAQQKRLSELPKSWVSTYRAAFSGRSATSAHHAQCGDCTSRNRKAIRACASFACASFLYRPKWAQNDPDIESLSGREPEGVEPI